MLNKSETKVNCKIKSKWKKFAYGLARKRWVSVYPQPKKDRNRFAGKINWQAQDFQIWKFKEEIWY